MDGMYVQRRSMPMAGMAGMPAMQEQLPAMVDRRLWPGMAGMPAMQEQLPAMARNRMASMPCEFIH
jgi:hypothetical protein